MSDCILCEPQKFTDSTHFMLYVCANPSPVQHTKGKTDRALQNRSAKRGARTHNPELKSLGF